MVPLFCYGRDSTQFGPYSATRMRELAAAGTILLTDDVWQEGADRKCLASRVVNLFAETPAAAAPTAAAPTAAAAPRVPIEPAERELLAASETAVSPQETPAPMRTQRPPEPVRKKRVIAIKGGVLMGQDGASANYRKKCSTCGWEDNCRSTAVIRVGTTRVTYFCRKCRKSRTVEMQSISS